MGTSRLSQEPSQIELVAGNLPAIVAEELALHMQVKLAVRDAAIARQPDMGDVARRLVELRDEASVAAAHDLPALLDQLHVHQSLAARSYDVDLPDLRSPYFAHMRIKENGRVRDILIGHKTFIDSKRNITIIDWKNAPIARIFFNYREGDAFTERLPGKVAEGVVEARRVIAFERGELRHIGTGDSTFLRNAAGQWVESSVAETPSLGGGERTATRGVQKLGRGANDRPALDIAALLDPTQYALLQHDDEEPLLILGGAGCGKTTVALHRLAALAYRDGRKFRQNRLLVIVPENGLVRLCKKLLASLGLSDVRVSSYDDWMAYQGKHLLRCVPTRLFRSTPAKIVRFKRHPALLEVLPDLELQRRENFADQIQRELPFMQNGGARFEEMNAKNLLQRVERMRAIAERQARESDDFERVQLQLKSVSKTFDSLVKQIYNVDLDRRELYTNETLLRKVAAMADGAFAPQMIEDLIRYSRIQFANREDADYSDIDAENLVTVDGQLLPDSEGGMEKLEGTVDVEDYSVLFAILKMYTGRLATATGEYMRYSHIIIDEAQELAPIELHRLGDALDEDGSVTIAGDAVQQTDPTASFTSWEHVLDQLGVNRVHAAHLTTNYRSPRPITEFAHAVLGPLAPKEMPRCDRDGDPILHTVLVDQGHAAMVLREALEDLMLREPRASVAVICRDEDSVLPVFDLLRDVPGIRLIEDGEFDFEPGIDVTDIAQIKGLEFDYVILPDVTIDNYPDTPEARRALHVAATRAMHQLWVLAVGKASPLLAGLTPHIG